MTPTEKARTDWRYHYLKASEVTAEDADWVTDNPEDASALVTNCLDVLGSRGSAGAYLANRTLLAMRRVVEEYQALKTDAARWRALMACDRIRILGGATRGYPEGKGLLGVEFYGDDPDPNNETTQVNREEFTQFADGLAAASQK